jgi:hypothetical protein
METFNSLELKLQQLSRECAELQIAKQKTGQELALARKNYMDIDDAFRSKQIELEALRAGLEKLYRKKLNLLCK